jgi:hypothetical protein
MPPPLELQRQLSRFQRLPESQDVWEGAEEGTAAARRTS